MTKEHLSYFLPELKCIQESALQLSLKQIIYHATCVSSENYPLGSGFHIHRETAHAIAVAEAIERKLVQSLKNSTLQSTYFLDSYPTTCGFAVGNTRFETRQRSVAEAIERWIRSKWIDDHFRIEELELASQKLNSHESFLVSQFESLRAFFHSTDSIEFDGETFGGFHSLIVVGYKDKGAFVGSRTSNNPNALWEHALVEAWRHLRIFNDIQVYPNTFDFKIVKYFGTNAAQANAQIAKATQPQLPPPRLMLHKEIETGFSDLYCYRSLCKDFKGWHTNEIERFVY